MRTMMNLMTVLALSVLAASGAFAQTDAKAPAAVQAEFDGYFAKFRSALKANDSGAVAALSKLPFMAEDDIATPAQFREKIYREDFGKKTRECFQKEKPVYDRDGAGNHSYSVFCGELIYVFTREPAGFLFTDIGVND